MISVAGVDRFKCCIPSTYYPPLPKHNVIFSAGLISYLNMAHRMDMPPDHTWSCRVTTTLGFISALSSVLFILSMTFDRFYSIIKPHKAASFNTVERAKISIICIVIFSVLYNIPHLFVTSNRDNICLPYGSASGPIGRFYYWMSFVIHFAFPFVFLLIMNSVIIHAISKSFKIKGRETTGEHGQGQSKGLGKTSETHVYATLLLVTFAFLICTTPAYVFFVFAMFYDYSESAQRFAGFHLFYNVAQKLQYTNYGINFFLYVMSGGKFRTDLMKLFYCLRRTLPRHSKSAENSTQLSGLS